MTTITKIGKYEVIEVLGRGGMGVVYKAMDARIGRMVAIKMITGILSENADLLQRFYREAQSTGMLQHPNIVIVYDLGDQEGIPYLVMEYLEGEALDKMMTSPAQIPLVEKLGIMIQVCNALGYAHRKGIVHRDIKPANVMVLKDSTAKIVDFGVARIGGDTVTRTGQVLGTINYMSPEQVNAQAMDGRTDIFSAGVMLYQLLTNVLPFEGPDTAATLLKILHEDPPPLSGYLREVPPGLENTIQKALAKSRDDRYASAEDFAFDLTRVQEDLKRQMVEQHISQAQVSVAKSEFAKAKKILLEVLKVDTQHAVARQLLQEAQESLHKEQRRDQVRQLQSLAQEAVDRDMPAEAIGYLDQAINLDKSDSALLNLRESLQRAKAIKERCDLLLRRAESAQMSGDLEEAEKAAAEALGVNAQDTQARMLHSAIVKQIEERERQQKMSALLEEAHQEISGRHFTSAFEVLKKAETIDPGAPEVQALMNLATAGREQEVRRQELERFTSQIEEALHRDDFKAAYERAEEALQIFPGDRSLAKLKDLAEKQRNMGEKRRLIDGEVAASRKLLDEGKAGEALQVLEKAAKRFPGETRLQSLLAIVRDSSQRESSDRKKNEFIQAAKDALRKKEYEQAIRVLESAVAETDDTGEIADLLQFARDETASAARRTRLDQAGAEAQRLMAENEYKRAIALLSATLEQTPDEELQVVLSDARRRVQDFEQKVKAAVAAATRLLDARQPDQAVTFLESQPKVYSRSSAFCEVLEKARASQEQQQEVLREIEKSRAASAAGNFDFGLEMLAICRQSYGDLPEIEQAQAEIKNQRSQGATRATERATRDARTLLMARQYAAALALLEGVSAQIDYVSRELRAQYDAVKRDSATGAARQQKVIDPGRTMVAGSTGITDPGEFAAPAVVPDRSPASVPGVVAVPPQEPKVAVPVVSASVPQAAVSRAESGAAAEKQPARRLPRLAMAAVLVVLGMIVGGYFIMKRPTQGPRPVASASYIAIDAVPWGTVKEITALDRKFSILVNEQTPVRVILQPGEYKIVVIGPGGESKSQQVKVGLDAPGSYVPVFEAVDVEKLVRGN